MRIRRLVASRRELKIELGAGDKPGWDGWTTIDLARRCDLYWDLRCGLPFPDGSVSKIYSSHFFEHLSFPETKAFLGECRRVLKPGGTFSICVPNARIYLEAYVRGERLPESFFGYRPAYFGNGRIDYVNYTAYMDGLHRYMFDEENLLAILRDSGLRNARLREFDPSLDREDRHFESIYALAER